MFRKIIAIAIKELKLLRRDGAALGVLFLLPVVFVTVMTVAGVGNQGSHDVRILVVNRDRGQLANWSIERLRHEKGIELVETDGGKPLDEEGAERLLLSSDSSYGMVVVFPEHFSSRVTGPSSDGGAKQGSENNLVRFIADPATGGQNLAPYERLVRIHVMEVASAASALGDADRLIEPEVQKGKPGGEVARLIDKWRSARAGIPHTVAPNVGFERVPPRGLKLTRPITAAEQNVPGYTIFGMFFIVQVIGNTLLREKESGTLIRLMAAPVSKTAILLGKLIPFFFVNVVQVIILFAFGALAFGVGIGSSVGGLLVVTLATAAVANALGLLIAAISRSAEQMGPMSGLILVIMAALGGVLVPLFEMPKLMQTISQLTPHAWALKGFQDVLVRGQDAMTVLPTAGVLCGFALLFYLVALLRFRFD